MTGKVDSRPDVSATTRSWSPSTSTRAHAQGCNFEIPLWRFGLSDHASIAVEDLLTGHRFAWTGKAQHVWLDPDHNPYAVWRLIPPGLPS